MMANEYQKLALRTLNKGLSKDQTLLDGVLGLNAEAGECASLTEIAAKAKAAGMSYGEYVTAMERWRMTSKVLAEIKRMNENGKNDCEIARAVGTSHEMVRYYRSKVLGLPPAERRQKPWTYKKGRTYTVYDGHTTQFVVEGAVRECAEAMGMLPNSFYRAFLRSRRGEIGRWEIHVVDGGAENENL